MSNAGNPSALIISHYYIPSFLAYGPVYHSPDAIVLNQCHPNFFGPMTQPLSNKISLMTHISGDTSAFAYGSKYSLATPPYALPHTISYFEYGYIQFTDIKEIPILDQRHIEFVFYPISSAEALHFPHGIRIQVLHQLKKGITFYSEWNISFRIHIFMLNSHDVNLLIACILMKLQRYVTRRHDFACYWRILLFCGLLRSQHMFFFVLIVLFRLLCIWYINLIILL